MAEIILPTFLTRDFTFDGPVMAHNEAVPDLPDHPVNSFALGVRPVDMDELFPIAVDIPDMVMAGKLLVARILSREIFIKVYGKTEDIYMLYPDQRVRQVYDGWGTGSQNPDSWFLAVPD